MEIRISEFTEGARKAEGLTVIIDVFRAFSVACYAFDSGIRRLIDVKEADDAFRLRSQLNNDTILVGERDEKIIPGFDAGNSPTELLLMDIMGKTMIHTTTAGTNGILNASGASEIISGSLVNASAVARYIKKVNPDVVSLVAMGYRAERSTEEDILCARYIHDLINGFKPDIREEIKALRHSSGSRFFDAGNIKHSPPSDFFLCTDINRFDFILKATVTSADYTELFKIDV